MTKGQSTRKRSFIGKALVLVSALFASGAVDKKAFATAGGPRHAQGTGWGGSAIFSPKRSKFKGFMRDPQYRAKRKTK